MRHRLAILALGLAACLLAGCDDERRAIDRDDLPAVDFEPVEVVTVSATGFDVAAVSITTGEAIEFVADGDDQGAVTSDDALTTGVLLDGESTLVYFDEVGSHVVEHIDDPDLTMSVEVGAEPEA